MYPRIKQNIIRSAGATLLEVMVAMGIMAFGLLGYAGLELTGMQNNKNAGSRTDVSIVANDLIERMRANPVAVVTGSYAAIDTNLIDCAAPPVMCEDGLAPSNVCTPAQIAIFDVFSVSCGTKQLAVGAVNVSCTNFAGVAQPCANNTFRTLVVNWQNQTDNGLANKNLTLTFRP